MLQIFKLLLKIGAADPLPWILCESLREQVAHARAHVHIRWYDVPRVRMLQSHVRIERGAEEKQREDQAAKGENVDFLADWEA